MEFGKKFPISPGCQLNLGCFCHKKDPSSWHEIGGKKGLIFEITLNKVRRPVASIIIQLFTFQWPPSPYFLKRCYGLHKPLTAPQTVYLPINRCSYFSKGARGPEVVVPVTETRCRSYFSQKMSVHTAEIYSTDMAVIVDGVVRKGLWYVSVYIEYFFRIVGEKNKYRGHFSDYGGICLLLCCVYRNGNW